MARILLVDDYHDALDVWSLYFKMCGFDVVTAADGPSALAAAMDQPPDIAILDLELPGLSGYDVARRLRAHPPTSALPLLAVSGHSHPSKIDEAMRAGFDSVLTKPCDPERLCLEIERLLSGHEQRASMPAATVNRHRTSHRR